MRRRCPVRASLTFQALLVAAALAAHAEAQDVGQFIAAPNYDSLEKSLSASAGRYEMWRFRELCGINAARLAGEVTRLDFHPDWQQGFGMKLGSDEEYMELWLHTDTGEAPLVAQMAVWRDGNWQGVWRLQLPAVALNEPFRVEFDWDASGLVTIRAATDAGDTTVGTILEVTPDTLWVTAYSAGVTVDSLSLGSTSDEAGCLVS